MVRLSGVNSADIAARHVHPWPIGARVATLCSVREHGGAEIDSAVVTMFPAPNSYTGETVIEIAGHGGELTPALIVEQLVASGARPAEPGEFTRRAVLNGKMDLLQAEAVADLIDASSRPMRDAAVRQLDGGLSRRVLGLRSAMLEIEALIAYDIDFPEEDEGPVPRERILAAVDAARTSLEQLLATVPRGELIRAGAAVVIAGEPNVGKSSLFNALIGRSRAIVTDVPGTTRDAIEAVVDGNRWPLRLIDTAGIRDTMDTVERMGVELSQDHIQAAHVVLACGDSAAAMKNVLQRVGALRTAAAVIPTWTKSDLGSLELQLEDPTFVPVSASTGAGLRELTARIEDELSKRYDSGGADAPVVTRARHRVILNAARAELTAFREGWISSDLPATVAAVHLRSAVHSLEELIGAVDVEDVLDRVFGSFCVGK